MPSPINHAVGKAPNLSLLDIDDGLDDRRVERARARLGKTLNLPEDVEFVTYVQPGGEGMRRGIYLRLPRAMVFMVVSPNPNPRYVSKFIKTTAAVDLPRWEEMHRDRAISDDDPALGIFADLCRAHLTARREWKELN